MKILVIIICAILFVAMAGALVACGLYILIPDTLEKIDKYIAGRIGANEKKQG